MALLAAGCGTAFWGEVARSTDSPKADKAKPAADKVPAGEKNAGDKAGKKEDAKGEPDSDKKDDAKKSDDKKDDAEKKDPDKKDEKKDDAEKPEEIAGHVDVRCVPVRRLSFAITVDGLGRTEPLPECVGSLTATVEGHVQQLLVKIGDTVKAGQPILQLDPTVAKATLAEKEANRESLVAALKLLESLPRALKNAVRPSWLSRQRRSASSTIRPKSTVCVHFCRRKTSRRNSFMTRKFCSSRLKYYCRRLRLN